MTGERPREGIISNAVRRLNVHGKPMERGVDNTECPEYVSFLHTMLDHRASDWEEKHEKLTQLPIGQYAVGAIETPNGEMVTRLAMIGEAVGAVRESSRGDRPGAKEIGKVFIKLIAQHEHYSKPAFSMTTFTYCAFILDSGGVWLYSSYVNACDEPVECKNQSVEYELDLFERMKLGEISRTPAKSPQSRSVWGGHLLDEEQKDALVAHLEEAFPMPGISSNSSS